MLLSLRNQKGITLIELMIVVAIGAILALLVYPNYTRMLVKSRQSEAKVNLGGVFVAERAYHTEYLRFGGFGQIGFWIAGKTNLYTYRTVSTDGAGNPAPQPGDIINAATGAATADNLLYPATTGLAGFTATATANLDGDPTLDEWYVNDIKAGMLSPSTDDVVS